MDNGTWFALLVAIGLILWRLEAIQSHLKKIDSKLDAIQKTEIQTESLPTIPSCHLS